jgi:hypothetical protein
MLECSLAGVGANERAAAAFLATLPLTTLVAIASRFSRTSSSKCSHPAEIILEKLVVERIASPKRIKYRHDIRRNAWAMGRHRRR